MKTVFKAIGKTVLSGALALSVLTAFCYLYFNVPVHYTTVHGATDYTGKANTFYSRGTEGFACGKTNNEGYTNMFDFSEDCQTDILIMGSSHMEAYQVGMDESTASRLNKMLPDDLVYNIGVSGHVFLTCVSNLQAAIDKYHPTKYIVIETSNIDFSESDLKKALNGEIAEIPTHEHGIIGILQQNQFIRLLYTQLKNHINQRNANDLNTEEATFIHNNQKKANEVLLDTLLAKINLVAKNGHAEVLIVYHPSIHVQTDASLSIEKDLNSVSQFKSLCNENSILFLDMSDRFLQEYAESYTLPYGFSNSSVGSGHLNKYGHAMIADEIYQLIRGDL